MKIIHLNVQGMSCGGCAKSVTAALTGLPGVSTVNVDLPTGHVTVDGNLPEGGEPLVLALTAAGYPAEVVIATTESPPTHKKSGGCCG